MSKALLKKEEKELSESEISFFAKFIGYAETEPEKLKKFLQGLSMLWRALEGQAIEPEDVFSGMINIKKIMERTRYPTILDMKRHVTLRLIAETYPSVFGAFGNWAQMEDEHFIALKGEGRKEAVEILKAKGMIAQGVSPVFLGQMPTEKQTQKGFLGKFRKGKEETD